MNYPNYYTRPHPDNEDDKGAIFQNTPSHPDSFYIPPPHTALQSATHSYNQHTQPTTPVNPYQTQRWQPPDQQPLSAYSYDAQMDAHDPGLVQTTTNVPGPSWPAHHEHQSISPQQPYPVDHQNLAYQPPSQPMMEYSNNAYETAPNGAVSSGLPAPQAIYPSAPMLESTYPHPASTTSSYPTMEHPSPRHAEPQGLYPAQQQGDAYPFHPQYSLEPIAATTSPVITTSYGNGSAGSTEPSIAYSEGYVQRAIPSAVDDPTYANATFSCNPQTVRHYYAPPESPCVNTRPQAVPQTQESYRYSQQPFIAPIPRESRCSSLAGWANLPAETATSSSIRPVQEMPQKETVAAYRGDEDQYYQAQDQIVHHQPHHQNETQVHHHQQQQISVPATRVEDPTPHHLHHNSPPTASTSSSLPAPSRPTDLHVETDIDSEDTSAVSPSGPSSGSARRASDFPIAPRPIEAVKMAAHVRQAAKLRVDVGRADINSPTSHEARLAQRRRRHTGTAPTVAYSPYQRERDERRASVSSQGSIQAQVQQRPRLTPPQVLPSPSTPSTSPTSSFGAHRTFIFNPYQHPQIVPVPDNKSAAAYSLPPPVGSAVAVGGSGGAELPPQHQTIGFSDPMDLKGKAKDTISLDSPPPEKKPFLACGFCRQRKIACGQRAPNERDDELPEGPRTCNQCTRRHILCTYPTESRRGLRKGRPARRIINKDGKEVVLEDDDTCAEGDPLPEVDEKSPKKGKKKGEGPMEWVIAVDAWLVTPNAWDAYRQTGTTKPTKGVNIVDGPAPGAAGPSGELISMADDPAFDAPIKEEPSDASPSNA